MENTRPQVNGFLNCYKPSGLTSMEVVRRIKKLTGLKKGVGHGGTLDPLAEGVLPICFGQATRLMEYLIEGTKRYHVKIHLGITTSTYDAEGEVIETREVSGLTRESVEEALKSFVGIIYQKPPMYSAIKVQGKRLYNQARAGIEVECPPRRVEVKHLELVEFTPPTVVLDVECGRGVYMRSLAHDLGETLGWGGYMAGLVRLSAGPFVLENSLSLDRMQEAVSQDTWQELLQPVDFVLLNMKSALVSKVMEKYIRNGQPVNLGPRVLHAGYMESYRAYTQERRFLAILRFDKPRNQWLPFKVFHIDVPSPYYPS